MANFTHCSAAAVVQGVMEGTNLAAIHATRQTIKVKDMQLARKLSGDN